MIKYPECMNKMNNSGDTPLHLIVFYGYNDLAKYCLLNNPTLVNLMNDRNNTIMHMCLDNIELFSWILENIKDINFNVINSDGITILNHIINNNYEIKNIEIILNSLNDDDFKKIQKIPRNNPPLINSIVKNKDNVTNYLLSKKFDPNIMTSDFISPLITAISLNKQNIAEKLIENGANVNYAGPENNNNPINYCILQNNTFSSPIVMYCEYFD